MAATVFDFVPAQKTLPVHLSPVAQTFNRKGGYPSIRL